MKEIVNRYQKIEKDMNEVLFLLEQLGDYYRMKHLTEADNCVIVTRKLLDPLVDELGELTLQLGEQTTEE